MIQIIPAILAKTEKDYSEKLSKIESNPSLEDGWVHIDFMDNIFVPNKSIDPFEMAKYPTSLKKEAHLMVRHFRSWVYELEKVHFDRIIIHSESDEEKQIRDELWYLEDKNIESGLAVNPKTSIDKIRSHFNDINVLLVMAVEPGFQEQQFIPETIEKVKEASRLRDMNNLNFLIGVDGGINEEVIKDLVNAGADYLVIGSHLLKGDIDENLETLWEAIKK